MILKHLVELLQQYGDLSVVLEAMKPEERRDWLDYVEKLPPAHRAEEFAKLNYADKPDVWGMLQKSDQEEFKKYMANKHGHPVNEPVKKMNISGDKIETDPARQAAIDAALKARQEKKPIPKMPLPFDKSQVKGRPVPAISPKMQAFKHGIDLINKETTPLQKQAMGIQVPYSKAAERPISQKPVSPEEKAKLAAAQQGLNKAYNKRTRSGFTAREKPPANLPPANLPNLRDKEGVLQAKQDDPETIAKAKAQAAWKTPQSPQALDQIMKNLKALGIEEPKKK